MLGAWDQICHAQFKRLGKTGVRGEMNCGNLGEESGRRDLPWDTIASINVKLRDRGGGWGAGISGAFDFSEAFLVKIPAVGPHILSNLIKYLPPSQWIRNI